MNKEETLILIKELLKECNITRCFFKNKMGMLKVTLGMKEHFHFDSSYGKCLTFAMKKSRRLELNIKKAQVEQALAQIPIPQLEALGERTYSIVNDEVKSDVSIVTVGEYTSFFKS